MLVRLCTALLLLAPISAARADETPQHLFYEAVPGAGPDAVPYEIRERFTERVRRDLVPAVLQASGVNPSTAETTLHMGGYLLRTHPALHTEARLADGPADRLAAALAWALEQETVLVADFAGGATAYAILRFPDGALTPDRAQRFFRAAAATHKGLGGGYTAFGDGMLFLNMRDADGKPYSGLEDASFVVALRHAADRFAEVSVTVAETGQAEARFIAGKEAQSRLGAQALAALHPLRARHDALLKDVLAPQAAN
jgi:hypothetical protein